MTMKTSCQRGHDLTVPENVLTKANGDRQCRVCLYAARDAWVARKQEERRASPDYRPPVPPEVTTCAIDGCDRPRGVINPNSGRPGRLRWCSGHYARKKKYGDLYEEIPIGRGGMAKTLPSRRAAQSA